MTFRGIAFLGISVIWAAPLSAQNLTLVADILPGPGGSGPSFLTPFGDELYFRASSGGQDCELWRTGGDGAERAADILTGPSGSCPAGLTVFGEKLYFSASGPSGAPKLWQFDGTAASLALGAESQASLPEDLIAWNGALYFRAFRSNIGVELWKFDGVSQTPIDLFQGTGSSYPQHMIEFNGLLYFNACGMMGQGTELWRHNGAWPVEAARIWPANGSSPENFAVWRGALYFSAYEPTRGRELWCYDGSRAFCAADIVPGPSSSNPCSLTVYGDALYFGADDGDAGDELWSFDGETARMAANVNPRPQEPYVDPVHHSWPADLTVYDDVLYFSADDGSHGRELWSWDGARASMVSDLLPGPYGSSPGGLAVWNGSLYLAADDGRTGSELWRLTAMPPSAIFLRGDTDADGRKNIADASTSLGFLFKGRPASLVCEKSADTNDSGFVDISDVVHLLLEIFRGDPPVDPPGCCVDSTPDELTCSTYGSCP